MPLKDVYIINRAINHILDKNRLDGRFSYKKEQVEPVPNYLMTIDTSHRIVHRGVSSL